MIMGGRRLNIYLLAWFPLVAVAIANGIMREVIYRRFLSELPASQLSTLSFVLLLAAYLALLNRRWRLERSGQAWAVGFIWVAMTVIFEFGFGHYIMGHSWSKLLHDYNLLAGRLWLVVLLAILTGPYLAMVAGRSRKK